MKSAFLKLHLAVLLAGFTAILGKLISLGEASLVWWRLSLTVAVMWCWMLFHAKKFKYDLSDRFAVLGIGALIGLHWLCFFGSVKYANVSISLVCLSSSGFFAALLEPVIRRKKLVIAELLLGLLSMAGIYIIFHFDTRYQFGIMLGVTAAALSAIFSILNKNMVHRLDSFSMTAWEMLGALVMLSLLVPFFTGLGHARFLPVGPDWLWLLLLSVVCTVWAFILQLQALQHISAFTLNLSYNLEPIYGIILAFLFFQENKELSPGFYVGVVLIILSIMLQMYRVLQARRKEAVPDTVPLPRLKK